jgi:hypothetical protein
MLYLRRIVALVTVLAIALLPLANSGNIPWD